MFDFKPSSDDPGDLVESSDDLGANLVPDAEDGFDDSDDDDVSDEDKAVLEPMFRLHTILFQCMEEVVSTILRSSLKKVRCCEIVE